MSSDALAERLLEAREAQGLAWAARARLSYILLGALLAPLSATTGTELLFTESLLVVGAALSFWILREAGLQRRLSRAAMVGIGFDVIALVSMPISWYGTMPAGTSPVFMLKDNALAIALVLAAVNALCLRPLYPLLVAGAGALERLGCLVFALWDSRAHLTWDPVAAHLGSQVHPVFFAWQVLSTLIIGILLAVLTGWARNTVRTAVQAEAQNWQLREEQARLVADAKLTGMGELVAGVAHELNTPLGAARSGLDSIRRASDQLADGLREGAEPQVLARVRERVVPALQQATAAGAQGLERIGSLMRALHDFSRLDRTEAEAVDLHVGLDAILGLIPPHLQAGVELKRDYAELPSVACRPAEVNQVLLTVVTNAFEAAAGKGSVIVRTRHEAQRVVVQVEDTGPGIAPDRLEKLFEVGLATKASRIGLRLGLPIARRVMHQHGGSISMRSQLGEGSCLSLYLPVA